MMHVCWAVGCTTVINPRHPLCYPHYQALPAEYRDRLWHNIKPGSPEWLAVVDEAIDWLRAAEARQVAGSA